MVFLIGENVGFLPVAQAERIDHTVEIFREVPRLRAALGPYLEGFVVVLRLNYFFH